LGPVPKSPRPQPTSHLTHHHPNSSSNTPPSSPIWPLILKNLPSVHQIPRSIASTTSDCSLIQDKTAIMSFHTQYHCLFLPWHRMEAEHRSSNKRCTEEWKRATTRYQPYLLPDASSKPSLFLQHLWVHLNIWIRDFW